MAAVASDSTPARSPIGPTGGAERPRERGIIFTGANVRAIMAGTKTQTRRVVRFPIWAAGCFDDPLKIEVETDDRGRDPEVICNDTGCLAALPLPYAVGDRLWVKETFVLEDDREYAGMEPLPNDGRPIQTHEHPDWGRWHKIPHYRATEPEPHIVGDRDDPDDDRTRWTSPIYMPRWASRLTLAVTDVRVQRLQDISRNDAIAEGLIPLGIDHGFDVYGFEGDSRRGMPISAYAALWNSIHGKDAWQKNPWVAAISFERVAALPTPLATTEAGR